MVEKLMPYWVPIGLLIFLQISVVVAAYLAALVRLRTKIPATREFSLLVVSVAVYALGYIIEISHTDLRQVILAIQLEYFGLAFVASLNLLFVLNMIRKHPLSMSTAALLFVIPGITLFWFSPIAGIPCTISTPI